MANNRYINERGASLTEYTIAVAVLVAIFIVISTTLYTATKNRAENSTGTVHEMTPCIPDTSKTPPHCLTDSTGTKCCYP